MFGGQRYTALTNLQFLAETVKKRAKSDEKLAFFGQKTLFSYKTLHIIIY
jgi:hypothetical protein